MSHSEATRWPADPQAPAPVTRTRCKFQCTAIEVDDPNAKTVKFEARYCPEVADDVRFSKYTPWGEVRVGISNPLALAMLEVGKDYYFDISPVPA